MHKESTSIFFGDKNKEKTAPLLEERDKSLGLLPNETVGLITFYGIKTTLSPPLLLNSDFVITFPPPLYKAPPPPM